MVRLTSVFGLTGLLAILPVQAADLSSPPATGRFRATCEDLGTLCFADACGRDQIDAALACRAQCPSSSVMSVVPEICRTAPAPVVLRSKG